MTEEEKNRCVFTDNCAQYGDNTQNLNQIPYNSTVEVTNIFKALVPKDRMTEELWTKVQNIIYQVVTKTIPKKKKLDKRQNGCLWKPYK